MAVHMLLQKFSPMPSSDDTSWLGWNSVFGLFFLPPFTGFEWLLWFSCLILPGFLQFHFRPSLNQHILLQVASLIILPLPVTVLPIKDMSFCFSRQKSHRRCICVTVGVALCRCLCVGGVGGINVFSVVEQQLLFFSISSSIAPNDHGVKDPPRTWNFPGHAGTGPSC